MANKAEQLQSELEQYRYQCEDDNRREQCVPAIKKLPAKLRRIAYAVLERDSNGVWIYDYDGEEQDKASALVSQERERLEALSAKDRERIFAAFSPKLAKLIENAWQGLKPRSQGMRYGEGLFRFPNRPETTLQVRLSWLESVVRHLGEYKAEVVDVTWLAEWAGHAFAWNTKDLSPLLTAAINNKNKEGDRVFEILCQSVRNEHPIARMGEHVTQAILAGERREGWALIEKTLLAAQRQEGLRQSIIGCAAWGHPDAFLRTLRLIVDENLIRFSSVVQQVNQWFGLHWDSVSARVVSEYTGETLRFLESATDRNTAFSPTSADDAESAYRALWATAFIDGEEAVDAAAKLLDHEVAEVRYAAVSILSQLELPSAEIVIRTAVDDAHLQVATYAAFSGEGHSSLEDETAKSELFDRLANLYHRVSEKPQTLKPLLWPWTERKIKRSEIAGLMVGVLSEEEPTKILPYTKGLDSWVMCYVVRQLAERKKWDATTRQAIFDFAGHTSDNVRDTAFEALEKTKLTVKERQQLEGYLTRKASDLRDKTVEKLRTGKDDEVLASADRLLTAGRKNQRLAGLEMIRRMAVGDQLRQECQTRGEQYSRTRKKLSKVEKTQLAAIASSSEEQASLKDALGLMNPSKRTPITLPKEQNVQLMSSAALGCIKDLDRLVHEHRKEIVTIRGYGNTEEKPLGEVSAYELPTFTRRRPIAPQLAEFPLFETWLAWKRDRGAELTDKDGLELVRACNAVQTWNDYDYEDLVGWVKKKAANKREAERVIGHVERPKLRYPDVVQEILEHLFLSDPPRNSLGFLMAASENGLALVSEEDHQTLIDQSAKEDDEYHYYSNEFDNPDWRERGLHTLWNKRLTAFIFQSDTQLSKAQFKKLWAQFRYLDEPQPGVIRNRHERIDDWVRARNERLVNEHDLIDALVASDHGHRSFFIFSELTSGTRSTAAHFEACDGLESLVSRIRDRLLEIELSRGEGATSSSEAALEINSIPGATWLFRIMDALGKTKFKINQGWRRQTKEIRAATLTELARRTFPTSADTQSKFNRLVEQSTANGFCNETRLLELAFLAPQWNKYIEAILGWDGFSEGVYWFIAHMDTWLVTGDAESAAAGAEGIFDEEDGEENDEYDPYADDEAFQKPQKLTPWERLVMERTPLSQLDRSSGAVDVEWFHRTWKTLGTDRWTRIAEAARFAANSRQARKAQFLADVLLGNTKRSELVAGIEKRKLKENVRLLGLLPLASGTQAVRDVRERWEILEEYKRYARTLSSLTKPAALRAAEIGFENLARLASYPDALRLQWSMEAESVRDLAKGPISITKEGVTVTLAINEDAKPELTVQRGKKQLRSIPAKLRKKHRQLVELSDRGKELRKQSGRIKRSLEAAMCRGDIFGRKEVVSLCEHAILAPQLQRLVLIGDGIMGYPDKGGRVLRDFDGELEPIKKDESLRLAHPIDFLASKNWHRWQRECFQAERVQPFKQVFRELYVVTSQERKDGTDSSRFAGQQIGPRQAMALWGSRGWSTRDEVFKTFHKESIVAEVQFQWDYGTAAEVEGLTMETVRFRRRDDHRALKLAKVPTRIFSEVMRDIDLVVSVAHRGEVDPEASASTVEMRASLISETCKLLGMRNVQIKKSHALIEGEYAEYSLNLGSGNVHRVPGGSIVILPVHAQHRGRLFLPFADDDPRTAEIISKVLLFAKDKEIQDPSILHQLAIPVGKSRVELLSGETEVDGRKSKPRESPGTGSNKKRHFETSGAKSRLFWEIELSDNEVTTSWGQVGGKTQSKTKTFGDDSAAQAEYDELIRAKLKKGYVETKAGDSRSPD